MTEPDEALLWARERALKYVNPILRNRVLSGFLDHDFGIPEMERGYRAGAAASAKRIKELEARVRKLEWVLRGMIEAASSSLPDRSKQHNLEVALEVLKEPDQ